MNSQSARTIRGERGRQSYFARIRAKALTLKVLLNNQPASFLLPRNVLADVSKDCMCFACEYSVEHRRII